MQAPILRYAQVVAVYPKYRCAEIVFCDDGWRVGNVPILHQYTSNNTGSWGMHNMPRPPTEQQSGGLHPDDTMRTVIAVVAMVDGKPLILGFQPHPLTQLQFIPTEQNRDITRHPSGTNSTVNKHGSMQWQHTGGTFVRVAAELEGVDPVEYQDLAPLCANGNWELPFNERATITVSSGDFRAVIRPNGDTEVLSGGNLTIRYMGNAEVDVGGSATVRVVGSAEVSAGGNVNVRTVNSATVTAGTGATVQTLGNARVTAAGSATVEALGDLDLATPTTINLYGTVINAVTPLFNVVGELIIEGAIAVAEAAVLARTVVTAEHVAEAAVQIAATVAAIAETGIQVVQARDTARETSEPAIGTGAADNLGGRVPGEAADNAEPRQ